MKHTYSPWDYIARHNIDDISMIKLKTPLVFSDSVQPACLDTNDTELYDGTLQVGLVIQTKNKKLRSSYQEL